MRLTRDTQERIYAGVLGKMIGVYLGRPVEGWTYEAITSRFGEISNYSNEELNLPLVVTDDDLWETYKYKIEGAGAGRQMRLASEKLGTLWKEAR